MPDALLTVPTALILVAIMLAATAVLGKLYHRLRRVRRNTSNLHKRRKLHGL